MGSWVCLFNLIIRARRGNFSHFAVKQTNSIKSGQYHHKASLLRIGISSLQQYYSSRHKTREYFALRRKHKNRGLWLEYSYTDQKINFMRNPWLFSSWNCERVNSWSKHRCVAIRDFNVWACSRASSFRNKLERGNIQKNIRRRCWISQFRFVWVKEIREEIIAEEPIKKNKVLVGPKVGFYCEVQWFEIKFKSMNWMY